jgi:hypothetical protein
MKQPGFKLGARGGCVLEVNRGKAEKGCEGMERRCEKKKKAVMPENSVSVDEERRSRSGARLTPAATCNTYHESPPRSTEWT